MAAQQNSLTSEQQFSYNQAEIQIEFEKDKACYEQNSEHLRSLNGLMWQIPLIAMTLTGGLWYGISTIKEDSFVVLGLLIMAAVTDTLLIFVMQRMRFIFGQILEKTRSFHPSGAADTSCWYLPNSMVSWIFCILLAVAAGMNIYGAIHHKELLIKEEPKKIQLTSESSLLNMNCPAPVINIDQSTSGPKKAKTLAK